MEANVNATSESGAQRSGARAAGSDSMEANVNAASESGAQTSGARAAGSDAAKTAVNATSEPGAQRRRTRTPGPVLLNERQRSIVMKHVIAFVDKGQQVPYAKLALMPSFKDFSARRLKTLINGEIRAVREERMRALKVRVRRQEQIVKIRDDYEMKENALLDSLFERTAVIERLQDELKRVSSEAEGHRKANEDASHEAERLRKEWLEAAASVEKLSRSQDQERALAVDETTRLREQVEKAQTEAQELRAKVTASERLEREAKQAAEEAKRLEQVCARSQAEVEDLRSKLAEAEKAKRDTETATRRKVQIAIDEHYRVLSERFRRQTEQMEEDFRQAQARLCGSSDNSVERMELDQRTREYERSHAELVRQKLEWEQWYEQHMKAMYEEKKNWEAESEELKWKLNKLADSFDRTCQFGDCFTKAILVEHSIKRTVQAILVEKNQVSSATAEAQLRGFEMKDLREKIVNEFEAMTKTMWTTGPPPWKALEGLMRSWWQTRNAVHHEPGVIDDLRRVDYLRVMAVICNTLQDVKAALEGRSIDLAAAVRDVFAASEHIR